MTKKILIAVTDKDDAIKISNYLDDNKYSPYIINDSSALMSKIGSKEYSALILDIKIVEESELNIIKFIREHNPGLNTVIISPKESLDRAVDIARRDGFSYMTEPVNFNELGFLIGRAEAEKPGKTVDEGSGEFFENKFVGKSGQIKKVMAKAKKVAGSDSNILITGETGTGKELVARAVYEMSRRANAPFIAINCAAIPENLLESELFGYRKGAFTGAASDKKGVIELADKGTLFLDEIGDLSLSLQSKLLRVIEYKELRRLGDESMRKVDIRIIAATNQDLTALIREKKFREDLFFRLNVIQIQIPPLRERKEDIPLLIRFFVEKNNKSYGRDIVSIEPKAKSVLLQYDYPGNVRELENIIQHAFAMSDTDIIRLDDLPLHLHNISPYFRLEPHAEDVKTAKGKKIFDEELLLSEIERKTIIKAFEKYGNNHTKAAKALGISRSTLWRKIKDYRIEL